MIVYLWPKQHRRKKNTIHHAHPSLKIQQCNNFIFSSVQNLKSSGQLEKFNKITYMIEKLNTICSDLD